MFFGLFGKQKDPATMLRELVTFNAKKIQREEGKTRREATYLAICLILDDMASKKSEKGYKDTMALVQSDYPELDNDVFTYLGWSSGKLIFKPEAEAAMKARHAR